MKKGYYFEIDTLNEKIPDLATLLDMKIKNPRRHLKKRLVICKYFFNFFFFPFRFTGYNKYSR